MTRISKACDMCRARKVKVSGDGVGWSSGRVVEWSAATFVDDGKFADEKTSAMGRSRVDRAATWALPARRSTCLVGAGQSASTWAGR